MKSMPMHYNKYCASSKICSKTTLESNQNAITKNTSIMNNIELILSINNITHANINLFMLKFDFFLFN